MRYLVGGLEHEWILTFPSYWKWKIIPTDELHSFFRGVGQPPIRKYDKEKPGHFGTDGSVFQMGLASLSHCR